MLQVIATIWYLNSPDLWFLLNISELKQREMDCTNWQNCSSSHRYDHDFGYSLLTDHDLGHVTWLGHCKWRWWCCIQTGSFHVAGTGPIALPSIRISCTHRCDSIARSLEQEDIEQSPSQSTAWRRVIRLPADDVWHEQQWPSIGEATKIQGHWLCNITEHKHSS